MKKLFFLVSVTVATLMVLSSCTKGTQPEEGEPEATAEVEYFVKYVSNGLSRRYNVNYTDANGANVSLRDIAGENFERTVGPVSKGFKAFFSIQGDYLNPAVRIEVKKGNNPFVVKAESASYSSSVGASVSYTIE